MKGESLVRLAQLEGPGVAVLELGQQSTFSESGSQAGKADTGWKTGTERSWHFGMLAALLHCLGGCLQQGLHREEARRSVFTFYVQISSLISRNLYVF